MSDGGSAASRAFSEGRGERVDESPPAGGEIDPKSGTERGHASVESMSAASDRDASYGPDELAGWLEQWALRREKVVHLIDLRAARAARELAGRCRGLSLEQGKLPDTLWLERWTRLRVEVARFLGERKSSRTIRAADGRGRT
jgi:hypothetical protein